MTVDGNRPPGSTGTRGQLVSVARALFAERGFAGTSTEALVHGAGVTRGALYYHFRDKQAVFRAVFEEVEEEVDRQVTAAAMSQPEPWLALGIGCEAFLDAHLDPAVQRIALLEAPSVLGWQTWREIASQHGFGLLVVGLDAAMVTGDLDDQPVAPLAHMLLGALTEGALFIARADDPRRARLEITAVLTRFLAGVRAR